MTTARVKLNVYATLRRYIGGAPSIELQITPVLPFSTNVGLRAQQIVLGKRHKDLRHVPSRRHTLQALEDHFPKVLRCTISLLVVPVHL